MTNEEILAFLLSYQTGLVSHCINSNELTKFNNENKTIVENFTCSIVPNSIVYEKERIDLDIHKTYEEQCDNVYCAISSLNQLFFTLLFTPKENKPFNKFEVNVTAELWLLEETIGEDTFMFSNKNTFYNNNVPFTIMKPMNTKIIGIEM